MVTASQFSMQKLPIAAYVEHEKTTVRYFEAVDLRFAKFSPSKLRQVFQTLRRQGEERDHNIHTVCTVVGLLVYGLLCDLTG